MPSVLLHGLWLLALLRPPLSKFERREPPPHRYAMTRMFKPAPRPPAPAPPPRDPSLRIASGFRAPEAAPAISREYPVDLNSIQISFADDVTNQLPEVVEANRGVLALLDLADPGIAHYIFEPPGWTMHEKIVDVSGSLRLSMDAPRKWPVFRTLAERHSLALEQYGACALFDRAYARCLQRAIGERAAAQANGANSRIESTRLAFAAGRPCGVQVLEVTFARVQ